MLKNGKFLTVFNFISKKQLDAQNKNLVITSIVTLNNNNDKELFLKMILQICFFNIGDLFFIFYFFAFLGLDAVKLYAASLRTLLKVRLIFPILIFL